MWKPVPRWRAAWFGLYVMVSAWVPLILFICYWKSARGPSTFEFFSLPWWGMLTYWALIGNGWLIMLTLGQLHQ